MGGLFPQENLPVRVPEANAPVAGGADAQVTLAWMLAEGEARHQVSVAHELT